MDPRTHLRAHPRLDPPRPLPTPPLLTGVIEGFYGLPWTPPQRAQLFAWMQAAALNTYMYAPKDDPHHRGRWRDPYSGPLLDEVSQLIRSCHQHGLRFLYALGPGLDLRYADPQDVATLEQRFAQLAQLGCHAFALLFDDIPPHLAPADAACFQSFAHAQCHVANEVFARLHARLPQLQFLFCPTEYCGRMANPSVTHSPYLRELGQRLDPALEIFWTGPDIIADSLPTDSLEEVARVLQRPPVLWDNLHANDYDMRRLFLGPCDGRPLAARTLLRGVLANPNCQFEANFVPIHTLGAWLRATTSWSPRAAYLDALRAWLPAFTTSPPHLLTLEHLEWLGDLFYLPLQHGDRARAFLHDLERLLHSHPQTWGEAWPRFQQTCQTVIALYDHFTALTNRTLLHAFYRHLWELKEELLLVLAFLRWRAHHPDSPQPFRAPEFRPGIFRGGFTADLQVRLPMDPTGAFQPASG